MVRLGRVRSTGGRRRAVRRHAARSRRGRGLGNLPRRDTRVHQDGTCHSRSSSGPGRCRTSLEERLLFLNPSSIESTRMKRQDFRFFHRLRVRWAEVDMQKIVFNAHYLMYFDTAISDYWRAMALPYEEAMQALGGDLYVKKATVEYHASARMDDQVDVALKCARVGNSSIQFTGAIFRADE